MPKREVVEDHDLGPAGHELLDCDASDVAGSTSDDDLHVPRIVAPHLFLDPLAARARSDIAGLVQA